MIHNMNPFVATDWYKPAHISMYHEKTEFIQSNMTPRSTKLYPHFIDGDRRIMIAGIQGFIKWFFIDLFERNFFRKSKTKAINGLRKLADKSIGPGKVDMSGIEALYDLGYLPLEIRALPEGSLVKEKVPVYTVQNTVSGFGWIVNYFESEMSSESWKTMTTATTMHQFRKLCTAAAERTCSDNGHLDFQCHMFAFRGESGLADSAQSEFGHLISFKGTDTIPSIWYAEEYYNMEDKFVAGSIPASEHSVATTNIGFIVERLKVEQPGLTLDEYRYKAEVEFLLKYITQIYPDGYVSYVADSYDYWSMITRALPELKEYIMARDGRLVMRPDSGVPEDIICGTIDWTEVEDFSEDCSTLEEAGTWMEETIRTQVEGATPHGERGVSEASGLMMYNAGLYKVSIVIEWNRHDKTYYFVEESSVSSITPVTLTTEEKGTVEVMWEIFGGTINDKGFKVLDPHIGLIYGDSITVSRAKEIFDRLEAKGFASSNIVLGVGSYTTQYATRDSLGFAVKATGAVIDGVQIMVSKEPKTDLGKKSAAGFIKVVKDELGEYVLVDNLNIEDVDSPDNELRVVFRDGVLLVDEDLDTIRERAAQYFK